MNFDSGDCIGLSMATATGSYLYNRPMSYDGTVFTGEGVIWYNDLNVASTLTAYHPYLEAGVPGEFSVAADQEGDGFAASDLLAAVRTGVIPSAAPVEMVFSHLMAKLSIRTENKSEAKIVSVSVGGSVLGADVAIERTLATVRDETEGTIRAHTVTAETLYEAVVVPQTVQLKVTILTDDGKSREQTLAAAELLPGRIYTIEASFSNIDIDVSVSGQVKDWTDGGSLSPEGGNGGTPGDSADDLLYGGAAYPTVVLRDGRTWMAANLRYVPQGMTAASDPADQTGIWYPCDTDASASLEEEFVRGQGLLYGLGAALGFDPTASDYERAEGIRGVCPEGWHIPTAGEFEALIAAYDAPCEVLSEFLILCGIRTVAGSNAKYNAMAPDGAFTKGYITGSSAADGFSEGKFLHLCIDCNSSEAALSLVSMAPACGLPVRCIRDAQ